MEDTIEEVIEFIGSRPIGLHSCTTPPQPDDHGNHDPTSATGHEFTGRGDYRKTQHCKNQAWRLQF